MSFSGPSITAHAQPGRPRHPKPRVLARRDFYFRSAGIVVVIHRSANEKESAGRLGSPGLPHWLFLTQNFTNVTFLELASKKLFGFFSSICDFFGGR